MSDMKEGDHLQKSRFLSRCVHGSEKGPTKIRGGGRNMQLAAEKKRQENGECPGEGGSSSS